MISRAKRDKLLMSEDEIPDNFIDRQLRESQYIAKKLVKFYKPYAVTFGQQVEL